MPSAVDVMTSRVTLAVGVIAIVGSTLTYMDTRHASAMDVRDLTTVLQASEVARIEYMIEELDRRIRRIARVPDADRDQFDRDDLIDMEARREYLLRELDRMEVQ